MHTIALGRIMITSKDLAKLAGVSQSTVSRALNDSPLISEEVKNAIKSLAHEHRFALNPQAQSLRTNRTNTIGILFPRFFMNLSSNLYFTYFYDLLQVELSKYDYDLLVLYDTKRENSLSPLEKIIRQKKIDGIILIKSDLTKDEMALLRSSAIPYISIFSDDYQEGENSKYAINTNHGGYLAGQFYSQFPDWEPLYISSSTDKIDSSKRVLGFKRGLGINHDIESIVSEISLPGAYQTVIENQSLFSKKRTVYVYNDLMACGVLMALKDLQIPTPECVQIVSNDDIPMASWVNPQLSTLRFPTQELVKASCERLVREVVSGKLEEGSMQLSPHLIFRGTTLHK
jgi:DNA-binding LacI/PurR family transcriptional regulator